MTTIPLPSALLRRLRDLGVLEQIVEACWNGSEFLYAPKTLVLFGSPELQAEAEAELREQGWNPRRLKKQPAGSPVLVEVDPAGKSLTHLNGFRFGLVYAQEAHSFSVASWCAERLPPRARVLDFCAAPGGKALVLGASVERVGGELWVNEPDARRRQDLTSNLRRCGAPLSTKLTSWESWKAPAWADVVLLDAPCSGEGLLRKKEFWGLEHWSEKQLESTSRLQKRILSNIATHAVCEGGQIVYATCTFSPEENESVVTSLAHEVEEWNIDTVPKQLGDAPGVKEWQEEQFPHGSRMRRFYPLRDRAGEGLFVAALQHTGKKQEREGTAREQLHGASHLWWQGSFDSWKRTALRDLPPLITVHADSFRSPEERNVMELPPSLQGLKSALGNPKLFKKSGETRAVLWRHYVLLVEWAVREGKTALRTHPNLLRSPRNA